MDSKTREFCGGRDPNTGRGCRDFPFCDAHSGRLTPDREDALRRQIGAARMNVQDRIDAAKKAYTELPGRFRRLHDDRYDCATWETWLDEDGIPFVGCREHHVEVAR